MQINFFFFNLDLEFTLLLNRAKHKNVPPDLSLPPTLLLLQTKNAKSTKDVENTLIKTPEKKP